ncbi:D-alanine--D-alanine ligase [Limosilactobacillus frumenti DSM 13145]|uniref:D-alanine--D-alanine ligase n=1 Tax=Limosilactobacillus frumenti DSM 13145 TaxID=1423746 RepID=A0A0R1PEL5_9LACO|nr:D-alanine--D-alanine ligase family protein [Limosilactobacillus frumenti]KRL28626.1 D-alanine--D-alanine ligase [Limosilactobacillus frumenti DSM 13145]MBA2914157.1 D-alanine--D-alanine ligase [Limosilactobacillus frumenti]QFG72306.1 D-alanine--D-alanine ligase [Limosilactobacillus frumenti]
MTNKLSIALLFGGNSSEHDVSKRSAHNIYDALDKNKYDVSLFMFTKDGILLGNADSQRIFDGEDEDQVVKEAYAKMDTSQVLAPILALNELKKVDLFFPVIHGNLGEDGTIQGLFKLLNKPYVGSNIAASAMSFDKDLTKKILTQAGIRNTPYVLVTPENRSEYPWDRVEEEIGDLAFVKPAKQGSSVGIHKVTNAEEYEKALDDAFKYDFKILVEQGIDHPQEVEISILGNEHPIASKLGAIRVPKGDAFYDYQNKFVDASGVVFELPVKLPQYLTDEITEMALKAYKVLGMKGMSRIDFLVDSNNVPYLGEPNTLPGFTNISLYPQMWEVSGISYSELIDRLIKLGLEEFKRNSEIKYDFQKLGKEKVGQKNYNDQD